MRFSNQKSITSATRFTCVHLARRTILRGLTGRTKSCLIFISVLEGRAVRDLIGRLLVATVALASVVLATDSANAALVTYGDLASWNAAVSGATTETIPDPAPLSFLAFGEGSISKVYGSLTFSQSTAKSNVDSSLALFNIGFIQSGEDAVISSQNIYSADENVNILIEFSSAVHGFAFNYGTFNGEDVTFELSNGKTFSRSSAGSGYSAADFIGVTDDDTFTSVLLTSTNAELALNVKNVSFASGFAAIPEPSSLALLGIGGIGIAFAAIRRRNAAAI